MSDIIIERFNMGGLADSRYAGVENSLAEMVGLDIHSKPGIVRVHQKLTKEVGANAPSEFCKVAIAVSNGESYWLSSETGKIWRLSAAGDWTLAHTTSPGTGEAKCLGALQYQEYIYWATELHIHRIAVADLADWASAVEDWDDFDLGDPDFHPMFELNGVLYIGDGNQIAQVDAGTFSSNALDLVSPYRITSFGTIGTDLLAGTFVNDNINLTQIIRWNTWSVSYTSSDPIPEVGINCFLNVDNIVLVSCGVFGNIYYYNGSQLEQYKRIPGDYSPTATCTIYPNAKVNFLGMPLFGVSNRVGNPCKQGVYSFGRFSRNYTMVLNFDYPLSSDNQENIEIGAMLVLGADLFVAWTDTNDGTVSGVDKLDYTAKYPNAYFKTRVIKPERGIIKPFSKFVAAYENMPTGTSLSMKRKADTDDDFVALTSIKDAKRSAYISYNKIDATRLEMEVDFGVSGNDAPEFEDLTITV